jgi:hypothetical protein
MKRYRPGPGWRHLAGSVYEHKSGVRIHLLGTVRLPGGIYRAADAYPDYRRTIRINGGNRKRGLMAWARRMGE